jgi:hypothetical protein
VASVAAIADGLKVRLATISGVRAYSYQPEQLNPPFAYPILNGVSYHQTMGMGSAVTQFDWSVYVVVGRWVDRVAMTNLDDFLSPTGAKSIRAALEADRTLGGACSDLVVSTSANISALEQDDAEYLQVSFSLTIYGEG